MIKKLIEKVDKMDLNYSSYALLRSVLALSTMLTLIFNSQNILFPKFFEKNEMLYSKFIIFGFNISFFIVSNIEIFRPFFIVILLTVVLGYYPRVTGTLHFLISYIFFTTSIIVDGGDQICSNVTLLLLPITLIDSNKNHWKSHPKIESTFGRTIFISFSFLICLQVSAIYLNSSLAKLNVPEWLDGTATWYWFNHEVFGVYYLSSSLNKLLSNGIFIYFLNYSIIVLELLIAMMLFVPKEQLLVKYLYRCGILFHVMIILIHGIFSFAIVMIGCLSFYFNKKLSLHKTIKTNESI
jgi:antimicrobial peptide system SdpB family protein